MQAMHTSSDFKAGQLTIAAVFVGHADVVAYSIFSGNEVVSIHI